VLERLFEDMGKFGMLQNSQGPWGLQRTLRGDTLISLQGPTWSGFYPLGSRISARDRWRHQRYISVTVEFFTLYSNCQP